MRTRPSYSSTVDFLRSRYASAWMTVQRLEEGDISFLFADSCTITPRVARSPQAIFFCCDYPAFFSLAFWYCLLSVCWEVNVDQVDGRSKWRKLTSFLVYIAYLSDHEFLGSSFQRWENRLINWSLCCVAFWFLCRFPFFWFASYLSILICGVGAISLLTNQVRDLFWNALELV
jgi:hypothetical protein